MAIVYITRRETFSAAHRLYRDDLSRAENERIYGKCAYDFGHGHNYTLEVTLRGEPDPQTGMVMNLVDLKQILRAEILDHVDHYNLNQDVPRLKGVNPTAENLVVEFWKWLKPKLPTLFEVKLRETENNQSVHRGEG